MCGRFTQRYTWREIHDLYDLTGAARNLQAHYNIAPTDTVEVVRPADSGATELVPPFRENALATGTFRNNKHIRTTPNRQPAEFIQLLIGQQ